MNIPIKNQPTGFYMRTVSNVRQPVRQNLVDERTLFNQEKSSRDRIKAKQPKAIGIKSIAESSSSLVQLAYNPSSREPAINFDIHLWHKPGPLPATSLVLRYRPA